MSPAGKEPSRLALYALTGQGAELAQKLAAGLAGARLFLPRDLAAARPGAEGFERLAAALAHNFRAFGGHVLFCAAGIVVRALAPLVADKARDPAVVVVDPAGRHAVSLLGGHLGGANALARRVAWLRGGQAVLTTAPDPAGLPSLEMVAAAAGHRVENLAALAGLSRRLLEGGRVAVWDPWGALRAAVAPWGERFAWLTTPPDPAGPPSRLCWVGWRALAPPPGWLVLRPPCLAVGMGCHRGTAAGELAELLAVSLAGAGLSPGAVGCLASVAARAREPALAELAARLGVPGRFFPADELNQVTVPHPSPAAARHLGVNSVCEAAAILASGSQGLLLTKRKSQNATLAVALAAWPWWGWDPAARTA